MTRKFLLIGVCIGVLVGWATGSVPVTAQPQALAVTVTSGSISCTNCSGSGASDVDDSSFGVGTDSVAPLGGLFDNVTPDSVDEGDSGFVRMSANRNLFINIRDAAGNERGLNIDVNGEAGNSELAAAVAGADNLANPTTAPIHAMLYAWDGSTWDRVLTSLTTEVTHATTLGTITSVVGNVFMGNASTATPTDVGADGDAAVVWLTRNGAVNIADAGGSITVDGSISCSNCSGSGASDVDNSTFVLGTDSGAPIMAYVDNTSPGSATEDRMAVLRASANRNLFVNIRDAAGNERGLNIDANGELGNSELAAAVAGADNLANPTTAPIHALLYSWDGSAWDRVVASTVTDAVEDVAETAGAVGNYLLGVRRDTAASSASASGENATLNTDANGLQWARHMDPCTALNRITVPISVAADTAVITAGGASVRTYICGGALVAGAAEVVNIWEGTGTACGTSSAALVGSTTEANGISLGANGGFIIPQSIRGIGTNVDVCIRLSTTNRVAGWFSYVQVAQ
jgi:hypothetical protein